MGPNWNWVHTKVAKEPFPKSHSLALTGTFENNLISIVMQFCSTQVASEMAPVESLAGDLDFFKTVPPAGKLKPVGERAQCGGFNLPAV